MDWTFCTDNIKIWTLQWSTTRHSLSTGDSWRFLQNCGKKPKTEINKTQAKTTFGQQAFQPFWVVWVLATFVPEVAKRGNSSQSSCKNCQGSFSQGKFKGGKILESHSRKGGPHPTFQLLEAPIHFFLSSPWAETCFHGSDCTFCHFFCSSFELHSLLVSKRKQLKVLYKMLVHVTE